VLVEIFPLSIVNDVEISTGVRRLRPEEELFTIKLANEIVPTPEID
jgi:hypothetical protein